MGIMKDRYLSFNAKTETPTRMIIVDTEANIIKEKDKLVHTLRLGHAIYMRYKRGAWHKKEFAFKTIEEWNNWLDSIVKGSKKSRIWIIAHNMSYDYALLNMDEYLEDWEIINWTVSPVFLVYARKNNVSFRIISSTNWFRESLKKLAPAFGSMKLESPDFKNIDVYMNTPDRIISAYCRQDTIALSEIVKGYIQFIKDNDLGNFQPTVASQALSAYRHRFMDARLLIHERKEILQLEIESYRGGRCEVFHMGKLKNVYKLDVNSMYPYVMKKYLYPSIPNHELPIVKINQEELIDLMKDSFVLANVLIEMKKPVFGIKREKLIFPIGRIDTVLTSPELAYIINHPEYGHIHRIKSVIGYKQEDIFSRYVDFFYEMKKNSAKDSPQRAISKIFLNGLYGKLAQKKYNLPEEVIGEELADAEFELNTINSDTLMFERGKENGRYVRFGKRIYKIVKSDKLAFNSMPRISSAVTSYARMELWKFMQIAGEGNYFYADTDSLIVNETGYNNLTRHEVMDESELGFLKLEEKGDCEIYGLKYYYFNENRHIKGIRENAIQLKDNVWQQEQFTRGLSRYRSRKHGIVEVRTVEKQLSKLYDKGKVLPSGKVIPLRLADY